MTRKPTRENDEKLIVYASIGDGEVDKLYFIPAGIAREYAALHKAFRESKTFRDFKARVPARAYRQYMRYLERPSSLDESLDQGPFCDGSWPGHPATDMSAWLPESVTKLFAERGESFVSGAVRRLDASDEQRIVAALEGLGYTCVNDEALICNACGYSN